MLYNRPGLTHFMVLQRGNFEKFKLVLDQGMGHGKLQNFKIQNSNTEKPLQIIK